MNGLTAMPPPGRATPSAWSTRMTTNDSPMPVSTPEERPEQADDHALPAQGAPDLLRGGADGRQHGDLAQPLGHDDAEGVVDDEGADEQGEDREALEGVLEHLARCRRSSRAGRRGSRRRSGPRSRSGTSGATAAVSSAWLGRPAQVEPLVLDVARAQPVEGRRARDRDRAAAVDRVRAAELRDADDRRASELAGEGEHRRLLADGEVVAVGEALVDGDLPGRRGRAALGDARAG